MTLTLPGGLLVAIDGIDGVGKTTLANGLRERFESVGEGGAEQGANHRPLGDSTA